MLHNEFHPTHFEILDSSHSKIFCANLHSSRLYRSLSTPPWEGMTDNASNFVTPMNSCQLITLTMAINSTLIITVWFDLIWVELISKYFLCLINDAQHKLSRTEMKRFFVFFIFVFIIFYFSKTVKSHSDSDSGRYSCCLLYFNSSPI